jgi:hypothetical protein
MAGTSQLSYTGVCVIRAEPQEEIMLISVTNPDIVSRPAARVCAYSTDVASAVLVEDFSREVAAKNLRD